MGDTCLFSNESILKNGRAAEIQGHIAADNIDSKMKGQNQEKKYKDSLIGLMELGTDGGMIAIKYPLPTFVLEWAFEGRNWMKQKLTVISKKVKLKTIT